MEERGFTVRYEAPGFRFSRLSHVGTQLVASSTEGYEGLGSGTWLEPGLSDGNSAEGYGGSLDAGVWLEPGLSDGNSAEGFGGSLDAGVWLEPGLSDGNSAEGFGGLLNAGSWLETDGFTGGTESAGGRSESLGVLDEGSWEW